MRLINTKTCHLEQFLGSNVPKYAILSHRWGDDEVTFAEYGQSKTKEKAGYEKFTTPVFKPRRMKYPMDELTTIAQIKVQVRSFQNHSILCTNGIRNPRYVLCIS
jgi:hypothetical protein